MELKKLKEISSSGTLTLGLESWKKIPPKPDIRNHHDDLIKRIETCAWCFRVVRNAWPHAKLEGIRNDESLSSEIRELAQTDLSDIEFIALHNADKFKFLPVLIEHKDTVSSGNGMTISSHDKKRLEDKYGKLAANRVIKLASHVGEPSQPMTISGNAIHSHWDTQTRSLFVLVQFHSDVTGQIACAMVESGDMRDISLKHLRYNQLVCSLELSICFKGRRPYSNLMCVVLQPNIIRDFESQPYTEGYKHCVKVPHHEIVRAEKKWPKDRAIFHIGQKSATAKSFANYSTQYPIPFGKSFRFPAAFFYSSTIRLNTLPYSSSEKMSNPEISQPAAPAAGGGGGNGSLPPPPAAQSSPPAVASDANHEAVDQSKNQKIDLGSVYTPRTPEEAELVADWESGEKELKQLPKELAPIAAKLEGIMKKQFMKSAGSYREATTAKQRAELLEKEQAESLAAKMQMEEASKKKLEEAQKRAEEAEAKHKRAQKHAVDQSGNLASMMIQALGDDGRRMVGGDEQRFLSEYQKLPSDEQLMQFTPIVAAYSGFQINKKRKLATNSEEERPSGNESRGGMSSALRDILGELHQQDQKHAIKPSELVKGQFSSFAPPPTSHVPPPAAHVPKSLAERESAMMEQLMSRPIKK